MHVNAKRHLGTLYLLAGVLLILASGVLATTPHDHDPNEFCRVCSLGERTQTPVDEGSVDLPGLEASTAPTITAAVGTAAGLLAATLLRGPPPTS